MDRFLVVGGQEGFHRLPGAFRHLARGAGDDAVHVRPVVLQPAGDLILGMIFRGVDPDVVSPAVEEPGQGREAQPHRLPVNEIPGEGRLFRGAFLRIGEDHLVQIQGNAPVVAGGRQHSADILFLRQVHDLHRQAGNVGPEGGGPAVVAVQDQVAVRLHPFHRQRLVLPVEMLGMHVVPVHHGPELLFVIRDDAAVGPDLRLAELILRVRMHVVGGKLPDHPAAQEAGVHGHADAFVFLKFPGEVLIKAHRFFRHWGIRSFRARPGTGFPAFSAVIKGIIMLLRGGDKFI